MIALALAFYLVFVLPARHLWSDFRPSDKPKRPPIQRYLSSIRDIGLLLLALLFICYWNGYSVADMGLALPASGAPLWCLIAAAVAMTALVIGSFIHTDKMPPEKREQLLAASRDGGMPTNAAEMRLFAVLVVFIGGGWELLYRGFLLLVLSPYIGTWGAVAVSGLAYGTAHGYKSAKQFSLSVLMALLFAAGYALTGSLWWLMVIHIVLPATNAINVHRLLKLQ
ncbi:CPBP family intramembrane metalloprotease [Pseudoduganella sp. FT55W]|uniref:CPBP family intramembrane metalloprotease n=1 Tax=Duganella rivi TaxID=2666083 RepID=A0A7X4KB08_9BURK|nr:CPBP family intramembrane glutamic endopeptidase [Duganella rivi]MYM66774.1 CPBP family intramembrane metalloprotease [Duganella rivi]